MRAYVLTTGLIFVALALAHAARLFAEGFGPIHEPVFAASSIIAVLIALWAFQSLRSSER